MAEIALAGAFLSPLLKVAFERISNSRKFIEFFKGKKGIKFDEEILDRLNITLYVISNVLEDAEVKEGAAAVRAWLGKVRAEVNHADDLLDEFNTECLRLQLLGDGLLDQFLHKKTEPDQKVHRIRFPFHKPKNNPGYVDATLFIQELMPNLEKVTTRLEDFEKQIQRLGLKKLDSKENLPHREPSSSVVDNSQFFGRDGEKEKMIERVLSDGGASDVSVIAITGMGGIGKTTLAQLVYNDDRVKEKFQTRAWVCVSEEYDALNVTKALLMEVNSAAVDDKDDFNRLQVKLKENLAGKSFLIILDDIWNENFNDWSNLKTPLSYGSRGSKIIVTTRNEEVALTMQTEPFHQLKPMSEDQSWSLFNKQAFDNGDHTPLHEFERIGKEIVKKCKGLPLAIKMIAGALRPQSDINGWQDFLSSEDWAVGGDILPALSLSYKHLPSHLKGCFAFCALFHKDVPFDKNEVVLLWMANDLVRPSAQKVGHRYFEELKSRSFFESVNGKKYLMHDLINDLARSVSGNTCIRLEDYQAADRNQGFKRENGLPPELLHFSYLKTYYEEYYEKFEWLSGVAQAHSLRTFLPIDQNHKFSRQNLTSNFFSDTLPRFLRLRAINLSQYDISMVPDSIGDLKHLRFLNLASTKIENLPNAICKCLNLQTLILKNCKKLVELPEDMRLLINLQHLDVRGVGEPLIKTMATWFTMFKDIQNISVVVDTIYGNVLEDFDKLHRDIKKLSIDGYPGTRFPDWLVDSTFTKMESLSLSNSNMKSLPARMHTQLSLLSWLNIENCPEIECFPEGGLPSSLETLRIWNCSKMIISPTNWGLQTLPSLTEVSLSGFSDTLFPEEGLLPTTLQKLYIYEFHKLESVNEKGLQHLSSLQSLIIGYCPNLEYLPQQKFSSFLSYVVIQKCPLVESFPEGLASSLFELRIWSCPKLAVRIESEKGEDWPKVSHIPYIQIDFELIQ